MSAGSYDCALRRARTARKGAGPGLPADGLRPQISLINQCKNVSPIETNNKFAVALAPGGFRILSPPSGVIGADDALLLAAWLLALAKEDATYLFEDVLEAVQTHNLTAAGPG